MEPVKPLSKDFAKNFVSGGAAGFATGLVVAVPESIKVKVQITPREHLQSVLRDLLTWKKAVKNVPFFSGMFAGVCAIEFSINDWIKTTHGPVMGVIASATSGGLLLVAADHTMFKKDTLASSASSVLKANLGKRLFTGFVPMFLREACFITSVMNVGPWVGDWMKSRRFLGDISHDSYNLAGRLFAGVPLSFASQPFDCLARHMQMHLAQTNESPSLLPTARKMWNESALFRGGIPRVVLATVGGAMVGLAFDKTRRLL